MTEKKIRVAILGAHERDLAVLGTLHNRADVEIAFVYDHDRRAVGVDIAEILGVPRQHSPEQLTDLRGLDFAVVSEPREKFAAESEILARAGVKLLNPSEVFQRFAPEGRKRGEREVKASAAAHTIDDTLAALEKLFDRKELLKFLLDVAVTAASATSGSIMLYSAEADELYIGYANGLSERVIKHTRQKPGQGVAGEVARAKQPRLLVGREESGLYGDSRERVDIGSAISVPLLWEGRLLGVLNVSVEGGQHVLDHADLDRVTGVSRRISRVLDQAMHLDAVQMRHREHKFRSTLGEIASKEISTREKFTILATYLSDLVGATGVELFLNTAEGDWFVLGGSNRVLSPRRERIRYQSGALSRSFLENRCLVLSERVQGTNDPLSPVSSFVYCPTTGGEPRGVIVVEFGERYKLDEFLMIREAVVTEISFFLERETRERTLERELRALRLLGDAAASVPACETLQALSDLLAATGALALESTRVSVRLRQGFSEKNYAESFFGVPRNIEDEWVNDDRARFSKLSEERKPFSAAFLSFDPAVREEPGRHKSVLAWPLVTQEGFVGAIIAYDKSPDDPLEDAVYTDLDRKVIGNLAALALPALESIRRRGPLGPPGEPLAFDKVLAENVERLKDTLGGEIMRSDRYHHTFTLVLFRADPLKTLFERDRKNAFALVEEITRGIKTRTRKTDFGVWIGPDTYAIVTLDGGTRIRYLISRITAYITKDLSGVEKAAEGPSRVLVGSAGYPGTSKTPDELMAEAEKSLKPFAG